MAESVPSDVQAAAQAVLRLLARPQAWTKGQRARNAMGLATSVRSPDAVCWSIDGAIDHFRGPGAPHSYSALRKAIEARVGTTLWKWNDQDGRTHGEVVELLGSIAGSPPPAEGCRIA